MWVWSADRAVLFSDPIDLTSFSSRAYLRLLRSSGPFDWNWDPLSIRNGFTSFSQANGSFTNAGRTGFHTPGPEPIGKR